MTAIAVMAENLTDKEKEPSRSALKAGSSIGNVKLIRTRKLLDTQYQEVRDRVLEKGILVKDRSYVGVLTES